VGATIVLDDDPFVQLFSESSARALLAVPEQHHDEVAALAEQHGVELTSVGRTGGTALTVEGQFTLDVEELRDAWRATLPAALGPVLGA
jgi:phosphoribosylformylglycinamidine synthase